LNLHNEALHSGAHCNECCIILDPRRLAAVVGRNGAAYDDLRILVQPGEEKVEHVAADFIGTTFGDAGNINGDSMRGDKGYIELTSARQRMKLLTIIEKYVPA
jgi:hypothetical protein